MDDEYIEAHDVGSRYVAGRLTDDEEREFEAHLVDCQSCMDAVESEMALRAGLRSAASTLMPQQSLPAAPATVGAFMPAYQTLRAAAAVLLAVTLGLGGWLLRSTGDLRAARAERDQLQSRTRLAEQSVKTLEQRLAAVPPAALEPRPTPAPKEPVVPALVFALTTVRGSSPRDAAPVNRIRIDGDARLVVFSLDVPVQDGAGAYDVSLIDHDGRQLWSGGVLPPSSPDSLGVAIDRAFLPSGDYVLDLSHRSPAGRVTPINRYPFRVEIRSSAPPLR